MQTVDQIINALGGSAHVFRETGVPLTTIESWKKAGHIPAWRRDDLLGLASKRDVALTIEDFPLRVGRNAQRAAA